MAVLIFTGWKRAVVIAGGATLAGIAGWFAGPTLVNALRTIVTSAIDSGKILLSQLPAKVVDALDLGKTLYRAMSVAEYEALCQTGKFSTVHGAMEAKWFATSLSNAQSWGRQLYKSGEFVIVKVKVYASAVLDWYRCMNLDGIGEAFCAQLEEINNNIISFIRVP